MNIIQVTTRIKKFNINNMSSRTLTFDEMTILGKGLKFIPTPGLIPEIKFKNEVNDFIRRLKWKCFFKNSNTGYISKFHTKTNVSINNSHLTFKDIEDTSSLQSAILKKFSESNGVRKYRNVTRKQKLSIQKLLSDDTICILPSDKNLGLVIMDTNDYIQNVLNTINQDKNFEKTNIQLTSLKRKLLISMELISKTNKFKNLQDSSQAKKIPV
jgi:hypothetical protein